MRPAFLLPALPLLAAALVAAPQKPDKPTGKTVAYVNATIHTGTADKPIESGTLVVRGGKIVSASAEKPPADAEVIDLAGKVVIPGLVDSHSHIGLYPKPSIPAHADGNEMSGPVQPGVRAIDAIWPEDPGIRMALAGGVTTANIMPGSGNVIGGQTLYVKLKGSTVEAMAIQGKLPDGGVVVGGLKMANGENPKGYGRTKQQAPFTRMKVYSLQREQFVKAREYQAKKKAEKPDSPVARDLNLEPLVEVLERKRTVHFHCHRADDLMSAVRLSEEFGFELVLQHASEGYRVASILASKKIPVSLTVVDSPGGKAETMGLLEENAAVLAKAGVPVCINTDDFITESRFLLRTASMSLRGGLTEAQALAAITKTPAEVMHLAHRVGTLEAGKDADFVVLSGAPFSVYTRVLATYIDGEKLFDGDNPSQRGYRDGGFALPLPVPVFKLDAVKKPDAATVPRPVPQNAMKPKPGRVYVRAGRIHTGGKVIADGAILIDNGVIETVGPAAEVRDPGDATMLTAAEVTPGLIDAGTVAGVSGAWNGAFDQDQDEPSDPNQAELRVLDGFNPREPLFEFLHANGVTAVHTTPGRVNVIGGTTGVFRAGAVTAEAAALKAEFALFINLGEVPKEAFKAKGPTTRMGVAQVVRKAFADAQAYRAKPPPTGKNPKLEALLPYLDGQRPVIFAAHRADDLRTALRLADEFKLKPVLALGSEAYLIADELAERKVPVIVHPALQRPGNSAETMNTLLATAAILKSKGVPVVLGTHFEGYVPKLRNLRSEAAMAAANGLGHAAALDAITRDAAKFLGIDDRYGSLEKGKVADLVLYDGDPFEHATHVLQTFMAGKPVYDRAEYLALPFERRALHLLGSGGPGPGCCME